MNAMSHVQALQIMLHHSATFDSVCDMMVANPIAELGGAKAVADALRARGVQVADVTVRSWTLRGRTIPAKYWKHIAALGDEKQKPISFEALAERVAA